jgi:hypothetical protein
MRIYSAIRLISPSGPETRHSLTPLALLRAGSPTLFQWYDRSHRRHKPEPLVAVEFRALTGDGKLRQTGNRACIAFL